MKYARWILVCALAVSGCRTGADRVQLGSPATPRAPTLVFVVGSAITQQNMRGVRVEIVGFGKSISLGETDEFGRVGVSKQVLRAYSSGAVLFCLDDFFCGAFRIDDLDLDGFDERLIHLAPVALR